MAGAPVRLSTMLVAASAGAGILVAALPSVSLQLALVCATAATSATIVMARAGRTLNPGWIIVGWIYLLGPVATLVRETGIGIPTLALLVLAPLPFTIATLVMRTEARNRLVLLTPLALLLILAGLSVAWSPSPDIGVQKLSDWALTGLLPAAFVLVVAPGTSGTAWRVIAIAAFVYALGLIVLGGDSSLYPGRSTLFIGNPIWEARAVFVGALIVIFSAFPVIAKVGLASVMIVAGLTTVSLGPFLALLLGVWAGIADRLRIAGRTDRRVAIGWAALGFATAIAVLAALIGASLPETAGLTRLITDDPNVTGRAAFLGAAGQQFLNAPIAGVGFGGFASTGLHSYPHNVVAEVGAELGTIGVVFLGVWLALAMRGAAGSPILIGLVVMTGTFALFSGSVAGNGEFWLFSALAVARLRSAGSAGDTGRFP